MTDRERPDRQSDPEPTLFLNDLTASQAEFAADLSAVQADDALLDALGGSDPRVADGLGDQELNDLLLAWRRDIDSEPLAELVDLDTAVTTVKTAALAQRHGQRARRHRFLVPVAAAAAVLAIAFTGTGLAARDAQPGDTLWGLTKVLYADHARSVQAAATAKVDLEKADIALASGRTDDARKALDDAQAALTQVSVEDDLNQLMEQHRQLSAQLQDPTAPNKPPTSTSQTQHPSTPSTSSVNPTVPVTSPNPSTTLTTPTTPTTPVPPDSSTPVTPTPTSSAPPSGSVNQPGGTGRSDNTDTGSVPPPASP
ncbi:MAG: hypothetical protein JWQ81_4218 [Amycolatopsis sp.]|uniref:anti-sigma-D factor RsdA n=1 Tax=Amycolatopsis sp. TaxID=37632 RepID=UPI002639A1E6|nr:anti-sigma-D factor RsdA [Amycolatopsis sp.]MCU1683479.1 hypothetical protein [Amycolatopsis sp.]